MKYELSGTGAKAWLSKPIDEKTYETVRTAKRVCILSLGFEEKLTLLLGNFVEFETELLKMAERARIWRNWETVDSMGDRLLLDRRLVNLLTACRLYLDQTEGIISDLFGNPSPELDAIRQFKHDLYDVHLGYRVMEALRNHVQHADLPIDTVSRNMSRMEGSGPDQIQFRIIPQSSVAILAENPKFKPTVLAELRQLGEKIDLRRPAREYIGCLCKLHQHLRDVMRARIDAARAEYEKALAEFAAIDGEKILFARVQKLNDDDTLNEEVALTSDFLEYSDKLQKENQINPMIADSYASNSDQQRKN